MIPLSHGVTFYVVDPALVSGVVSPLAGAGRALSLLWALDAVNLGAMRLGSPLLLRLTASLRHASADTREHAHRCLGAAVAVVRRLCLGIEVAGVLAVLAWFAATLTGAGDRMPTSDLVFVITTASVVVPTDLALRIFKSALERAATALA